MNKKEGMSNLFRFGVSIEENLINRFDKLIKQENYNNRSEAIRDLMRESLVRKEWLSDNEVAGTITIVYDHHRRGLLNALTGIQHKYHDLIISSLHVHLTNTNCIEVLVVKGHPKEVKKLSNQLKSLKGVKHCTLSMTTTGIKLR